MRLSANAATRLGEGHGGAGGAAFLGQFLRERHSGARECRVRVCRSALVPELERSGKRSQLQALLVLIVRDGASTEGDGLQLSGAESARSKGFLEQLAPMA